MQSELEVMRVIRVPPLGSLVVFADGRRLTQISAANNERLRQRLLAAIGELISFAGGYDELVSAGVAPSLPTVAIAAQDDDLSAEQAAFLNRLEREMRGDRITETLLEGADLGIEGPPLRLEEAEAGTSSPGVNLVAEIDLLLQKHIAANEELAQRSIHLRQSLGELLQIVVDGKVYEHPNDIEDAGVKEALKRALKEWEAR